jgi:hypothetical protein
MAERIFGPCIERPQPKRLHACGRDAAEYNIHYLRAQPFAPCSTQPHRVEDNVCYILALLNVAPPASLVGEVAPQRAPPNSDRAT